MEKQIDLKIDKNTDKALLKKDYETEVPTFKTKITLSEDDKKRIFKEIEAELNEIKKERDDIDFDNRLDSLDQQYIGEMQAPENMQFDVTRKTTAIKVNTVVRAIMDALFGGDQVFTVTPRPDADEKGARESAEKQADFIDYKIEEVIPLEEEMCSVAHDAVLKLGGILKLSMKHKRQKRKAEECYEGKWEPVLNSIGEPVIDPQTQKPRMKNEGLEAFLRAYPDAKEKYPQYVKQLAEGKRVDIIVEYEEVIYDDPMPKYVDPKNFFARNSTNGLDGLRDAYLIAERKVYKYWELKQEEKEEKLFDIDSLTYEGEGNDRKQIENFASREYELYECVFNTKLGEEKDYVRCVFHVSLDKQSIHGADYYPYWGVDTYYFPFNIRKKGSGLWHSGIGEDLSDLNLAESMLLCFMLEGAYASNLITPIVKDGSKIAEQFNAKQFTHGMPLIIDNKNDIPDFLNKYFRPQNSMELMGIMQSLRQEGGSISGASEAFATGQVDPLDPQAPAAKTRDLLNQSGINIKDFIKRFAMTFNAVGGALMQMYYQRGQQKVKYRINPDKIAAGEGNPFDEITRADMAARTNFRSTAFVFDVDRLNAKKEDMALMSILNQEPLFRRNEDGVYTLLRTVTKGWSEKWKNNINRILPTPEQFQKQRIQIAVAAVGAYAKEAALKAKATGQPPEIDPRALIGAISQALTESFTPPPPEVVKAREKGAA